MTSQIKGTGTSTFGGNVDVTGNVITDAPAFSAYLSSSQIISANTWTKVAFDTKEFDLTNDYDNTTNYRFTPSVEGYYLISSVLYKITTTTRFIVFIRKNGDGLKALYDAGTASLTNRRHGGSALVYCNGSTDYIEIYMYQSSSTIDSGSTSTYFQGHLVRAV